MKNVFMAMALVICSTFPSMKVAEVDPATSHFKASKQATTVVNKSFDLDNLKQVLLITDDFIKGQINNIERNSKTYRQKA